MAVQEDLADLVAGFKLFADLSPAQLEAATHSFDELWFTQGQRIVRRGFSQPDFFVIVEGEAMVRIAGEDKARLTNGDFFGEISVLLREPPTADVVALTPLRCMRLAGTEVHRFLTDFPEVMFRVLQAEAGKLRSEILWRP
jgi:CRP-like cAMP-binding protein